MRRERERENELKQLKKDQILELLPLQNKNRLKKIEFPPLDQSIIHNLRQLVIALYKR